MHDSDYEGNEKPREGDLELSANNSGIDVLQKDAAGVTKNLRVRKQINYNENQLPGISGEGPGFDQLNLSGSKRTFQAAFKEEIEPAFAGSQVRGLKRARAGNNFHSNDDEYAPSVGAGHGALRHAASAANLLQ